MNSERTAFQAIVTVALLAALVVAPAAAGEITANGTPADDDNLTMATAGNTLPFPDSAPGLAAVDGAATITTAGTSVPAFAAGVGSDEGWYRIQCNVDGANVYFDGHYMGITSGGQLYVPVYTTGSPYSTIRVEKSGYHTYTASLPSGPAAGETREVYVTLQLVAPGDTVTTVSVSGVPDNASFLLTIRNVFATTPGEAFEFTIRDLSLPFSLNSGEVNAYTRGTDWTELVAALPDGGSVIMRLNADANDEVWIALPRNLSNGTFVPLTFRGEALGNDIIADFTILGTKQGLDDGQISFTIEGIEQGTMTGSVYVDGSEILSWGGSSGGGAPIPTPMPTPTPMWTPTPSQTPAVPRDLGITSNKDTVIRGNSFCVTITGESRKYYDLTITNTTNALSPVIAPGQVDVTKRNDYNASVRTTAAGTRTVQFNTNSTTRCATYIIRVADSDDRDNKYDEVQVRVDEGAVTITASGTGVYYIGEEITLSGTNSDSDTTYLFLTGPNLPTNGVRLLNVTAPVENGDPATFTRAYVEADDTWFYKWNTADVGRHLDASGYTIYAAAQPQGKGDLTDVRFATTSIVLRAPSLTIQTSGATLTPGDDYRVSGIATGYPYAVQVWILGPDYYHSGAATVESDGTFEYVLAGADTSDLTEGRYYVIVQNPGCNGFDIWVSHLDPLTISGNGIIPVILGNLQAPEAANALISALDSPNIDDIYANFTFIVRETTLNISPDAIAPGGTVTVNVSGLPDGAAFSLGIRGDFAANPEGTFAFTIRDLTLPFALTLGEVNAYTKGTDWTELTAELPDGDSVIMRYNAGPNGEVRISQPRNIPSGTLSVVTLRGEAAATSIIADLTVLGTKQGPNDGTISFAIEGVDQGTATVTVFVDGSRALSRAIAIVGDPAPLPGDNLTLSPGWNFVSIPRPLAAGNDTTAIFAGVDVDGHSALRYDTANRSWINLKPTDPLAPLEGFWIYSAGPATVPLNFSTDSLLPAERTLAAGWNAIGVTGTAPATARDTLYSVNGQWTTLIGYDAGRQAFETGIVNGGSGANADARSVVPGRGYWLSMTGPGTLYAIGA